MFESNWLSEGPIWTVNVSSLSYWTVALEWVFSSTYMYMYVLHLFTKKLNFSVNIGNMTSGCPIQSIIYYFMFNQGFIKLAVAKLDISEEK